MLQTEHIYRFFCDFFPKENFSLSWFEGGVPTEPVNDTWEFNCLRSRKSKDFERLFTNSDITNEADITHRIFLYDQEPLMPKTLGTWLDINRHPYPNDYDQGFIDAEKGQGYYKFDQWLLDWDDKTRDFIRKDPSRLYGKSRTLVTSEISKFSKKTADEYDFNILYYFFHGFAALDWFRGFQILNYNKNAIQNYKYDYQSFNRIITGDRAYRKTFVDQLRAKDLLEYGAVSYGVTDGPVTDERLVIDHEQLPGSASADIPDVDAFWHVVTETVFYYDKLHLTEKIFKPIVSKQPFMLLAAPGNLEYLRSYGFKTFAGIIDESYDSIKDNDARIEAVVAQLKWYCDLSDDEKTEIQRKCEPIVEHNFQHFYGKFREIITDELLDNTKKLFKDIGYDDDNVDYATVRKLLTS